MTQKEQERLRRLINFDLELGRGRPVFGMDEVGRGALVGPVVAACVCIGGDCPIEGVNDSKRVSPERREVIAERIRAQAVAYGIGMADEREIERHNILNATKIAMSRAYAAMGNHDGFLLIDAIDPAFLGVEGKGVCGGDAKSYAIAAASILAKTYRDALMTAMAGEYPGYGFEAHKGYGTRAHRDAIRALGPCPRHRLSFLKGICHVE